MVNIAQHIQKELASREETMSEFLERTKLPRMTVYRAIRGEALRPKTKGRIASALQRPVDELFPPAAGSSEQAQENADASSSIRDDTTTPPSQDGPDMKPPASGDANG